MIKSKNKKRKKGAVVILDALGVKNLTLDESEDFINKKELLIKRLKIGIRRLLKILQQSNTGNNAQLPHEPDILTFGDSIIIIWELDPPEQLLMLYGIWLKGIIKVSLELGLRLRGAVSIGDYIADKDTAIGPAIADAAYWYEMANWIGLIATPYCGLRLEIFSEQNRRNNLSINDLFVKYSVPLRNAGNHDLWVLSWPSEYIMLGGEPPRPSARQVFLEHLKTPLIPFGTEEKIFNTISFFDWYSENIKRNVP